VNLHVGAGRRVDVTAVLVGLRRQTERIGVVILEIDAGHARRSGHGDVVDRRGHGAGHDAVFERTADRPQLQTKRSRRIGSHRRRPPCDIRPRLGTAIGVGRQHLRSHRGAIPHEPRFDGQGRANRNAGVARFHIECDPRREEHQRQRVERAVRDVPSNECEDREQQKRRSRLEPTPAQTLAGDDGRRIDVRGGPVGVGEHRTGKGGPTRRIVRCHQVNRAHQAIVERRVLFFDEAGHLRV